MPRRKKGQLPVRMQVEVPKSAYGAVLHLESVTGQDRKVVVGKTLEWLSTQNETTQKMIIGAIPEAWKPAFAKTILEQMANPSDAELADQIVDEAAENERLHEREKDGKKKRQA